MNDAAIAAYLRRIGCDGAMMPTLDRLQALHRLHPQAIPFENLSPLAGETVDLADEALVRKLVEGGRGGYCYEHNLLFLGVLRALGYAAHGLAARVRWNVPDGVAMARTHMLLAVDLPEGRHIADVGFGGWTLTAPLMLVADVEQTTPHGAFRLRRDDGEWTLEAQIGADWRALYTFDATIQQRIDYEVTSWYLCHHPRSRFVSELLVARIGQDCRLALRDNRFSVHRHDRPTEMRTLTEPRELLAVLGDEFGLRVPADDGLGARLAAICARAA